MTIQNLYPNIDPTLLLDFANVKALDPRITFARASAATYYGTETAKAEENLVLRSQEFDNSFWGKTNVTVTANTEVAPDGTTTADTITDDATNDRHVLSTPISTSLGTDFVFSCFLKAGTSNHAALSFLISLLTDRYATVVVDLSAGTITDTNNSTGTTASSTITSVGNGWYRVALVARQSANAFTAARICVSDSGTPSYTAFGQPTYVGTGSTIHAWGAQLEQRDAVTAYTPTTTQPITNFVPVLESAAAGEARFDHNPVTGESLGLLIEESRTNVLIRSEEFDNAAWGKIRSTITANTIVAPDGTLTGDKLVENTDNNTHLCQQAAVYTSGQSFTMTVYAKAGERPAISLITGSSASALGGARFNLTTGVATIATGTLASFSMTPVGNGWFRCQITQAATFSTTDIWTIRIDNGTTTSYTGNGFSGIFIWGASLEQGAFPTSYVKTTTAQVTRAADAASMTGANFSSFYNQAEWTMYSEHSTPHGGASTASNASACIWGFNNPNEASFNGYSLRIRRSITIQPEIVGRSGAAAPTAGSNYEFIVSEKAYRTVGFIDQTVIGNCVDGRTVATTNNTVFSLTNPSELRIGEANTGGLAPFFLNGHIRKLAYYPKRIANAELQALTS